MRLFIYKIQKGLLVFAVGMLLYAYSEEASAAIYSTYFSTPGGTGNDCSMTVPCALQTALDKSYQNDSIYLDSGTYTGSDEAVISLTEGINIRGGWDGLFSTPPNIDPQAHPTIIDAEGARRGIYIDGAFSLDITGLRVTDGNATGLGGYEYYGEHDAGAGIFVHTATVNISDCEIFANNNIDGNGGGIFLNDTNSQVHNNKITDNIAQTGGGIATYKGAPTIKDNVIGSNTAGSGGGGGGIYCFSGSPALQHNLIADNNSSSHGGGITIATCNIEIRDNTIINNMAVGNGGGIRLWYSESLLVNNIIADNHINAGSGSGIWMGGSQPIIKHATIVRNTGGDSSGVFVGDAGSTQSVLSLINTIIADQAVGVLVDADSSADINATLWGSDSWANGTDHTGSGTVNIDSTNITGNPSFADPDKGNYHITAASAAIDAGIDAGVTEDIDDDIRPKNRGYDIGADEHEHFILAPVYYLLGM